MSEFMVMADGRPMVMFSTHAEALKHARDLAAATGLKCFVTTVVDEVVAFDFRYEDGTQRAGVN